MKITVIIARDDEEVSYRRFCVKPETDEEVHETNIDVVSFINDCHDELKEEGF
jgi:hypothetical protein